MRIPAATGTAGPEVLMLNVTAVAHVPATFPEQTVVPIVGYALLVVSAFTAFWDVRQTRREHHFDGTTRR